VGPVTAPTGREAQVNRGGKQAGSAPEILG
jgi:hypothetical protein